MKIIAISCILLAIANASLAGNTRIRDDNREDVASVRIGDDGRELQTTEFDLIEKEKKIDKCTALNTQTAELSGKAIEACGKIIGDGGKSFADCKQLFCVAQQFSIGLLLVNGCFEEAFAPPAFPLPANQVKTIAGGFAPFNFCD